MPLPVPFYIRCRQVGSLVCRRRAFLRPDIQVTEGPLPDFNILEQSKEPEYLMFALRKWDFLGQLDYCHKRKKPAFQIMVDHTPILQIYKFGGVHS